MREEKETSKGLEVFKEEWVGFSLRSHLQLQTHRVEKASFQTQQITAMAYGDGPQQRDLGIFDACAFNKIPFQMLATVIFNLSPREIHMDRNVPSSAACKKKTLKPN